MIREHQYSFFCVSLGFLFGPSFILGKGWIKEILKEKVNMVGGFFGF